VWGVEFNIQHFPLFISLQFPSSCIAGHSAGSLFIKEGLYGVAERDSKLDFILFYFCLFLFLME
jgi:hypothetical protein